MKGELINMTWAWDEENNQSPWQESNPWRPEHMVGALLSYENFWRARSFNQGGNIEHHWISHNLQHVGWNNIIMLKNSICIKRFLFHYQIYWASNTIHLCTPFSLSRITNQRRFYVGSSLHECSQFGNTHASDTSLPDLSCLITSLIDSIFATGMYDLKVSPFVCYVGSNIEHHWISHNLQHVGWNTLFTFSMHVY